MPLMSGNILRNFFAGPATRAYPMERRKPFAAARARLVHDPERCSHCGICAHICPTKALRMEEDREALVIRRIYDPFACIYCVRCVELCPEGALRIGLEPPAPASEKTTVSSSR